MNEEVTVSPVDKSGNVGNGVTYSVVKYAKAVLSSSAYASFHPTMKAILNYGAYSEVAFGGAAEGKANEGFYSRGTNPALAVTEVAGGVYVAPDFDSSSVFNAQLDGTKSDVLLSLGNGDIALTFKILYVGEHANDLKATYSRPELNGGKPAPSYTAYDSSTKLCSFSINNINAYLFDDVYTVTLTDGVETLSLQINVLYYLNWYAGRPIPTQDTENGESDEAYAAKVAKIEKERNVARALVQFYQIANNVDLATGCTHYDTLTASSDKKNSFYWESNGDGTSSYKCGKCFTVIETSKLSDTVNTYLSPADLNVGDGNSSGASSLVTTEEEPFYRFTVNKAASESAPITGQKIWLREKYHNSKTDTSQTSSGDYNMLTGPFSTVDGEQQINIGKAKYMVLKMRTGSTSNDPDATIGMPQFYMSTLPYNNSSESNIGQGHTSKYFSVPTTSDWKTFVVDLSLLDVAYKPNGDGTYTIDSFWVNFSNTNTSTTLTLDIRYIAFVDDLSEVSVLTAGDELTKVTHINGTGALLEYCTDGHTAKETITGRTYTYSCSVCGTVFSEITVPDSVKAYLCPGNLKLNNAVVFEGYSHLAADGKERVWLREPYTNKTTTTFSFTGNNYNMQDSISDADNIGTRSQSVTAADSIITAIDTDKTITFTPSGGITADQWNAGTKTANFTSHHINIDTARYMVMRVKTDIPNSKTSNNVTVYLGTDKQNDNGEGKTQSWIRNDVGIRFDALNTWTTVVFDLDLLYNANTKNTDIFQIGEKHIIDTFMMTISSSADNYLDMEYVAFVDDWNAVEELTVDSTVQRILNKNGTYAVVNPDGTCIDHVDANTDGVCDICDAEGVEHEHIITESITSDAVGRTYSYTCSLCGDTPIRTKFIPSTVERYFTGKALNVPSGFRTTVTIIDDSIYSATGTDAADDYTQHIWLRASGQSTMKAENTEGVTNSTSGGQPTLDVGAGNYMIVKVRSNNPNTAKSGILTLTARTSSDRSSGGPNYSLMLDGAIGSWHVFVINMAELDSTYYTKNADRKYIIQNFFFTHTTGSAGKYLDFEYIAFADSWEDIDAVVDEDTVRYLTAKNGAYDIRNSDGSCTGDCVNENCDTRCDKCGQPTYLKPAFEHDAVTEQISQDGRTYEYICATCGDVAARKTFSEGFNGTYRSPAILNDNCEDKYNITASAVYDGEMIFRITGKGLNSECTFRRDSADHSVVKEQYAAFDVGTAEYVVIKIRSSEAITRSLWISTEGKNSDDAASNRNGIRNVALKLEEANKWTTFVFKATDLIDSYVKNTQDTASDIGETAIGHYVIDSLGIATATLNTGTTYDIAYIAFANDWSEIDEIVDEPTVMKIVNANGSAYEVPVSDPDVINAYLSGAQLNTGDLYQSSVKLNSDGSYCLTHKSGSASLAVEQLWIREVYYASEGDQLGGKASYLANIDIGTAQFMVVRIKTPVARNVTLYLGTTAFTYANATSYTQGGIMTGLTFKTDAADTWTTFVVDLNAYGDKAKAYGNGDRVIDSLKLSSSASAQGEVVLNIEYIAFVDSWTEVDRLVDGAVKYYDLSSDKKLQSKILNSDGTTDPKGYTTSPYENGVAITGVDTSISGDITLPSYIGGNPVVAISHNAFEGCTAVTSVTIPEGVAVLGNNVFAGCTGLTSVSIPASTTTIGSSIFYGCTALETITVNSGNTAYYADGNCLIETSTRALIAGCKTSVIPEDVASIAYGAFKGTGIASVTIMSNSITIGEDAFAELGDDFKIICHSDTPAYTYAYENSIKFETSHFFGNDLHCDICDFREPETFYIYKVIGGKAVITNVDTAISGNVIIPQTLGGYTVTAIEDGAFAGCTKLTGISIPSSVTSIGTGVFASCSALTSITVGNSNTSYRSSGNCLIDIKGKTLIAGCKDSIIPTDGSVTVIGQGAFEGQITLTQMIIPTSITLIENNAFKGCSALKAIDIPASVATIGDYAFYGCSVLKTVTFAEGLTSIGKHAFTSSAIASITLPESLRTIDNNAFYLSSITDIVIPAGVETIGTYAFYNDSTLKTATVRSMTVTIGNGAFGANRDTLTILCHDGSTAQAFAAASLAKAKVELVHFYDDNGYCEHCSHRDPASLYTFEDTEGGIVIIRADAALTGDIVIPEAISAKTVVAIGEGAFSGCRRITSVSIPATVTSIASGAFHDCTSLASISATGNTAYTVSDGLLIENATCMIVASCNTATVTIPNTVTAIGADAFNGCTALKEVTIPASVLTIGDGAFSGCTSLDSVLFESSATNLGTNAFADNSYSLTFGCHEGSAAYVYATENGISVNELHYYGDDGACYCGENKDYIKTIYGSELNVGTKSNISASVSGTTYTATGSSSTANEAQHIWLREKYAGVSVATGTQINIGKSKYMVVKLQANYTAAMNGSLALQMSTTGFNDLNATVYKDISTAVYFNVPELNTPTVFVFELSLLGNRYAPDASGDYIIDTLFLSMGSVTSADQVSIEYIAFTESFTTIETLVGEGTYVRQLTDTNGSSALVMSNGKPLGSNKTPASLPVIEATTLDADALNAGLADNATTTATNGIYTIAGMSDTAADAKHSWLGEGAQMRYSGINVGTSRYMIVELRTNNTAASSVGFTIGTTGGVASTVYLPISESDVWETFVIDLGSLAGYKADEFAREYIINAFALEVKGITYEGYAEIASIKFAEGLEDIADVSETTLVSASGAITLPEVCAGDHPFLTEGSEHYREACEWHGIGAVAKHSFDLVKGTNYMCSCGYLPECHGEHTFTPDNGETHSHAACEYCGKAIEGEEHVFESVSEEADGIVTHKQACAICGYENESLRISIPASINAYIPGMQLGVGSIYNDWGIMSTDGTKYHLTGTALSEGGNPIQHIWLREEYQNTLNTLSGGGSMLPMNYIDVGSARYIVIKMKTTYSKVGIYVSTTGKNSPLGGSTTGGYNTVCGRLALAASDDFTVYVADLATLHPGYYVAVDGKYVIDSLFLDIPGGMKATDTLDIAYIAFAETLSEVDELIGNEEYTRITKADGSSPSEPCTTHGTITESTAFSGEYTEYIYTCGTCGNIVSTRKVSNSINKYLSADTLVTINGPYHSTSSIVDSDGNGTYHYRLQHKDNEENNKMAVQDIWLREARNGSTTNGSVNLAQGLVDVGNARFMVLKVRTNESSFALTISTTGKSQGEGESIVIGGLASTITFKPTANQWSTYIVDLKYMISDSYVLDPKTGTYILDTFYIGFTSTDVGTGFVDIEYISFVDDLTKVAALTEGDSVIKRLQTNNGEPYDFVFCVDHSPTGELIYNNNTHVYYCEMCGKVAKTKTVPQSINLYLSGHVLNVDGAYQGIPCFYIDNNGDAYYRLTTNQTPSPSAYMQHVWAREKYNNGNSGGSYNLSPYFTNDGYIGKAQFMVVRLRTNSETALTKTGFNMGSAAYTYKDNEATGQSAIYQNMKLPISAINTWETFVIPLDLFGEKFKAAENLTRTIDTFILDTTIGDTGEYIDISFIAFADNWTEIAAISEDATVRKVLSYTDNSTMVTCETVDLNGNALGTTPTLPPEPAVDGNGEYAIGESIEEAGISWNGNEDAFALRDKKINDVIMAEKTAAEMLELLKNKDALMATEVYSVTGVLTLDSDTTYFGNGAAIIANDGILISDASNVAVRDLIICGNVTVTNSVNISFYNVEIKGTATAVTVDQASSDVAFKSCIISATDENTTTTAISSDADRLTVYMSRLSADRGIVSTGSDLTVQDSKIHVTSLGISSAGDRTIVRNNDISVYESTGTGVKLDNASNGLVALNIIKNAQTSVAVNNSFNCAVILNSAISLVADGNTNIYIIDNSLGGTATVSSNNYIVADGNRISGKNESLFTASNNTNVNGSNMHDVNARSEYGVNEELLPHENSEQFVGMERREYVTDAAFVKKFNYGEYLQNTASEQSVVIVPPGAYSLTAGFALSSKHSNTDIYSYGVYVEAQGGNTAGYYELTKFVGVENMNFAGVTWGYTAAPSGQIHVLEKLENNQIRVINPALYPTGFGKSDSEAFWSGGSVWRKDADAPFRSTGTYTVNTNEDGSLSIEDNGTFIITLGNAEYELTEVGDIWTCRLNVARIQTVSVSNSKNIHFKDVTCHGYANATHWRHSNVENVSYERAHAAPNAPFIIEEELYNKYIAIEETYGVDLVNIDENKRLRGCKQITGGTGTMEVADARGGVSLTSCTLESMFDDGTNQRGTVSRVAGIVLNDTNGNGQADANETYTVYYKGSLSSVYHVGEWSPDTSKSARNPGATAAVKAGDMLFAYGSNGAVLFDGAVALTDASAVTDSTLHMAHTDANSDGVCDNTECLQQIFSASAAYKPATNSAYNAAKGEISFTVERSGHEGSITYTTPLYSVEISASGVNIDAIEGYDLLSNDYDPASQFFFNNSSRNCPEFTFDNVYMRAGVARGMLVKTNNVTIKHCTFKDINLQGIKLGQETNWGEGTVPRNITIANCVFDNTSSYYTGTYTPGFSQITIQGLGGAGDIYENVALQETFACSDITIDHNKFVNVKTQYIIDAWGARDIKITNNIFEERRLDGGILYVNSCLDVTLSGNTYSDRVNNLMGVSTANSEITNEMIFGEAFKLGNFKRVTIEGIVVPDSVVQP